MADERKALAEVAEAAGELARQRELRDRAIRRARGVGAPVAAIAEAAGLSRMGVYRVLEATETVEEPD